MQTAIAINVYTDNGWMVEDLTAEFEATWDDADRSVGDPGGWSCEFLSCQIGGLPVTRDMLTEILSRAEVTAIEETAAESLREYRGYDALAA